MIREFKHQYTCPGCGEEAPLVTRIDEASIKRSWNPAPFIATEKMATERRAAAEHARKGCHRPV